MSSQIALPGPTPRPVIERLLLKSDINPDGCWLYSGGTNGKGYGVIGVAVPVRRMDYVHRVMFQAAHGPIPEGHEVGHTCDVRNCIRPSHLVAMTHDGNIADMTSKQRQSRGERRWSARLTEDQVRGIRVRAAQGEARRSLAREFGVSISSVDNVINRKRWAHVE